MSLDFNTIKHGKTIYKLNISGTRYRKSKLIPHIKTNAEIYQTKNNISVKCISDRVLLYLRYVLDEHYNFENKDKANTLRECVMMIYKTVRGDPTITNRNPMIMAAAILYTAGLMRGINISQKELADLFEITDASIQNNFKVLYKFLKPIFNWP